MNAGNRCQPAYDPNENMSMKSHKISVLNSYISANLLQIQKTNVFMKSIVICVLLLGGKPFFPALVASRFPENIMSFFPVPKERKVVRIFFSTSNTHTEE